MTTADLAHGHSTVAPCRGGLVQIDGSDHHWLEDCGPRCTLLMPIDDATSELMELRFVESKSAFS